jgi:hypothetical protein
LGPEIERAGFTKDQIQTDAELKLRMAGIKVLSREERLKEPGMPFLYVNASVVLRSSPSFVYHIEIYLGQKVILVRDVKTVSVGYTWSTGSVGITPNPQYIRDKIKDLVDIFINAYLSVNPK